MKSLTKQASRISMSHLVLGATNEMQILARSTRSLVGACRGAALGPSFDPAQAKQERRGISSSLHRISLSANCENSTCRQTQISISVQPHFGEPAIVTLHEKHVLPPSITSFNMQTGLP